MTRSRRGYFLIEMIGVILLIGATAIVVTRLTSLIVRVYRDVPASTNALRSQRQWLTTMRDDAWAATRVDAGDGLTLGDVRWTFADGTLTRTAGDDVRHWPSTRAIAWRWDGRSLVVVGDADVPLATPSVSTSEAR